MPRWVWVPVVLALAGCSTSALPVPVHNSAAAAGSEAAVSSSEDAEPGVGAEQSVVRLSVIAPSCNKKFEGTGFVYAPQRVVTAAHVVAGAVPVSPVVTTADGNQYEGRVVAFDPEVDVAVLYVPKLPAPPLRITAAPKPLLRIPGFSIAQARMLGYPKGAKRLETQAVDIEQRLEAKSLDLYKEREVTRVVLGFSAEANAGLSGAPLILEEGTVAGMVFAAAKEDPEEGYALAGEEILAVTQRAAKATKHVSTQRCEEDG
ncbi:trypsin-like peptidase domain-containing protein [Nonomuraea gerenzanensis]|uniref:Putative serine protease n=1 Tax=Nonomuraea gerenzanensis TaxID=93944 RepID=A0A1M4E0M8_9ACTN|nr:trypsin-like peptidase domain-containing protein [Nonomuraea gerenzanensis]UBU14649.1 trypsin-like peptidase domain-containing protein [Nonomuraea gerenzanensis]SBO92367.1 putative serine protease [Nonomuraea gerenzanensis]